MTSGLHRQRPCRLAARSLAVVAVVVAVAACGSPGAIVSTPAGEAAPASAQGDVARIAAAEWSALPVDVRGACAPANAWHSTLMEEAKAATDDVLETLDANQIVVPAEQRAVVAKAIRSDLFWRIVRNLLIGARLENIGGVRLPSVKTASGEPLWVFRSAFTGDPQRPGSCVDTLIAGAGVRHIVNLYAGPMPTADLEAAERAAVTGAGGTYATLRDDPSAQQWREQAREGEDLRPAMEAVASILRDKILRPGGKAPIGHVQVHCGGGMHRTGMVIGVLERCVGGLDSQSVTARYKHHVGWIDATHPGGFEAGNLRLIETFDCTLLGDDAAKPR
jgi:hypothetical protein